MYEFALFLHVLGVVVLVGAVTTTLVATLRAQRAATVTEIALLTAVSKKIDPVMGLAMALVLGPGLYMVSQGGDDGSIRWSSGWVDVAIVVFAVMAVLGPTVEAGHAKRVLKLAGEAPDGPVPPELDAARRDPVSTYVAFFGASQILGFLYLMTNKPGLAGAVATCAVAGVLSAAVAAVRLRSLSAVPVPAAVTPEAPAPRLPADA